MRGLSRRHLHVITKSKTNIKPASPTPLKLNQYILASHDLGMGDSYTPMIFFYSNPQPLANKASIPNLLKNSLSNTLSKYYPLSGTLSSSGSRVQYNDRGIHFFEARIECNLSEILGKTPSREEEDGCGHLFPPGTIWGNLTSSRDLLAVQLNHFSCGGIALAVSLSHRIGDALTFLSFLTYWATLCRNPDNEEKLVHLSPTFAHQLQQSSNDGLTAIELPAPEKFWNTTEMVFPNSKIAKLKAEVEMQDRQDGVMQDQKYTRNELVTALLYRCAVAAATASNSGAFTKSVLLQLVNTRPLIDPPLPKTSFGNLITLNDIPTTTMNETRLNALIAQMREGKMQLKGSKSLANFAMVYKYAETNHKLYFMSSICNFPLYDEMDFGWGRPVKAAFVDTATSNHIIMMDTPSGDGINTIVGLEEQDMTYFLANKDLLAYASF